MQMIMRPQEKTNRFGTEKEVLMSAREKLNVIFVGGALVFSITAGLMTGSPSVFFLSLGGLLFAGISTGLIRL